jgi:hypothetical protein
MQQSTEPTYVAKNLSFPLNLIDDKIIKKLVFDYSDTDVEKQEIHETKPGSSKSITPVSEDNMDIDDDMPDLVDMHGNVVASKGKIIMPEIHVYAYDDEKGEYVRVVTNITKTDKNDNIEIKSETKVETEVKADYREDKDIETLSKPENHFIGYIPEDIAQTIAISTPADEAFIAEYKKQYTDETIKNALNECKQKYEAKINNIIINNVSEHPIQYDENGDVITDNSICGQTFNEIYAGVPLVKLSREDCMHYTMKLQEGLNIDINPFQYDKVGGPDGIYFCRLEDVFYWIPYDPEYMYMWDVEIPSDATTCMYHRMLKTDRLILKNQRKISDYISSKLMNMVVNNGDIDRIFRIINAMPRQMLPGIAMMEEIYLAMLARDFALWSRISRQMMPSYDNLMMYLAKNDKNAYLKLKSLFVPNNEIIMQCIKTNEQQYGQMSEILITNEMSQYVFEKSPANYRMIINDHKTLEMTTKYLAYLMKDYQKDKFVNVLSVPKKFWNEPQISPILCIFDPSILRQLEYRGKTYETCLNAVKNAGVVLDAVPLCIMDQTICNEAVMNSTDAYTYVPQIFRTVELNQIFIKSQPGLIMRLDNEDIKKNLKVYFDTNPEIIRYAYCIKEIDDELALYIVKKCPYHIGFFTDRSLKFIVECVKVGAHFNSIPPHKVTQEILADLVTCRANVIKEMPVRFISDELYCICMKVHGMKLEDIPEQYVTDKFTKFVENMKAHESI